MDHKELRELVLETAVQAAERGPGWAQQSMVLREVANRMGPETRLDLNLEQAILGAWHELFLEGKLSWGYNLDNPSSPFFHVRKGQRGEVLQTKE